MMDDKRFNIQQGKVDQYGRKVKKDQSKKELKQYYEEGSDKD